MTNLLKDNMGIRIRIYILFIIIQENIPWMKMNCKSTDITQFFSFHCLIDMEQFTIMFEMFI